MLESLHINVRMFKLHTLPQINGVGKFKLFFIEKSGNLLVS